MTTPNVEATVREVMTQYGIPEYIWKPIMLMESRGDPTARNITNHEHSIGLYQINIKANPQYERYNLTDPRVNAEIAAKDFILPAYRRAISKYSPDDTNSIAVYSYQEGIRPYWTGDLERKYLDAVSTVIASSLPAMEEDLSPPRAKPEDVPVGVTGWIGSKLLTGVFLVVAVIVFFISLLQLFPLTNVSPGKIVKEIQKGKAGVSK